MGICRRHFGACLLGGATAALVAAPPRAKLLILVVLEQLRADALDTLRPQLAPGGLRKIFDKGAVFPNCLHLASTFSSTALTTLATGAWPAQHGIVADLWYNRVAKRAMPLSDEDLLATTLAAQFAADRGRVTVLSLDRNHGALFSASPDARLFWLDDQGQFATNGEMPDWLPGFNSQHGAESARGLKWSAIGAKPDAPPLRTLNFSSDHPRDFLSLYKGSPYAQSAQFELAAELITRDRMGAPASPPDLLCILAGSSGQLGYETGGRSALLQQLLLQFDRRLEAFFGQLARTPGDGNYNLAIAGAHGAPPEPSPETRERMAIHGEQLAQAVDKVLAAAGNTRVEKYVYPFLHLTSDGARDPEPARLLAARAALQFPGVAAYYTAGGACSVHDQWEDRFRNSFHPTRSGDVMLSYRPEYIESFGQGRGVSYGSLYNYDARVPLCFFGPAFAAGGFEQTVASVDFAPTLARVAGIDEPSSSVGRVLAEALAE